MLWSSYHQQSLVQIVALTELTVKNCKQTSTHLLMCTLINTTVDTKCASNPIVLAKGAKNEVSEVHLERRDHLLTFLQGSAKKQSAFKKEFPEEHAYFSKVWTIRNNHMIKNLSENYVFMLYPCYKKNCPHLVCLNGKPKSQPVWFKCGPLLTYFPSQYQILKGSGGLSE